MTTRRPLSAEALEREHVYCEVCGDRMVWTHDGFRFDRYTGEKIERKTWSCANTVQDHNALHDSFIPDQA
jgi:hypothetical protein